MSAKYKSPSFLLPNELNTSANTANDTGINSLYSMEFGGDSSASYIDLGVITQLEGLTNFSFSIWFTYPLQNSGDNIAFGNRDSNNSGRGIAFSVINGAANNSYLYFVSAGSGSVWNEIPNSLFNTGWNHLVTTYDGTTLKSVVNNGTPITDLSSRVLKSTTNFKLGADGNSTSAGLYYTGRLDEFCIFTRTISDQDITALWNGGSPASAATVLNLNPLAYYPLGEQAQNTGYLGNEITNGWQFPNGVLQDYVMDFDGVNDFVDLGDLQPSTTSLSISAWAYKTDTSNASIIGRGASVDYGIFVYGGNLQFGLNAGGWTTISTTLPTLNKWFHVLATWNGSIMKLSVNGGTPVTTSKTGTITYTSNNTTIGKNSTLSGFEWDGKISNVAIWNSDQSANIANIYNNGSPQTSYTVTPQNWWKLNADSVYTPSAPNYTTSLNLPQPLSASNYIDFPAGGSGWSFNDGAGNDTPFTVSAWVYNTSSTSKYRLLSKNNGGNGYEYSISAGGANALGSIEIYLYDSTGSGTYIGSKSTLHKPNEWVHVAFTYDASAAATGLKIYANGEQLTDTDVTVGSYTSMGIKTSKPNIGRTVTTVGSKGNVSNLTIFSSELTASQISTLFNFGTPETTPSFSPNLWFKLDNTTTGIQSAGSLTGASYNGTIGGSITATSPAGVAIIPSWKIPSELPITTPNYTTALDFVSSESDSINTGSSGNVWDGTTSLSVSLWVNLNSNGTFQYLIDSNTLGNPSIGFTIALQSNGNFAYCVKDDTNLALSYYVNDIGFTFGNWHHIVLVYDRANSNYYYYNNGTPYTITPTVSSHSHTAFADLYIGRPSYSTNYHVDGKISNVAVFNSALTLSQVSTLFNNATPEASISFSPVSWWKLDTGGSTITDYGSGGNNGTNNGATKVFSNVVTPQPVNGVSTTLPSTALQQSDLQFDSPYSNYSLKFSTSQSIDTNFTLPASYTSYSYSFWYRSTAASIGTSDYYIISNFDSSNTNLSGARGAVRFNNSTKMRIFGGDNTNYYLRQYEVGSSLLDQQWHNVVVTFTNTEVLLYVDGVSISAETTTNTPITGFAANRSYTIGQSGVNSGYLINSKLDEFAIFNKKLTEAEILSIYNNGKPSDISTLSPTNWWRLGENAYFVNNDITLPNSISGAPNGVSSGTATSMLSADAPGTYANGVGTNLDIVDRVGDAALSIANSQSYNMIPDDKVPYVPGYVGDQISNTYSMTFDAASSTYFQISNSTDFDFGTGDFTWSLWVNYTVHVNYAGLLFTGTSNSEYRLKFQASGQYLFLQNADGDSQVADLGTNITGTGWHHLCLVRNSGTITTYLDSSAVDTDSRTGNVNSNGNDLLIGRNGSSYFNGKIDEVAMWNTALTPDQIKFDLYNATTTGKTADIANNPNLPTPVAWYRMGD